MKLGEAIAGVATGFTETDVGALADFGAGVALPVMEDASSVGSNIKMFKVIVSILILGQIAAVSIIATRLRGGGKVSALGQIVKLIWVAGITSLLTSIMLDGASSMFGI